MGERFLGNIEEGCSTLQERKGIVSLVAVSMLGSLKAGGFRVLFLIEGFFGSFCRLIEHKLGGGEKHEL